MSYMVWSCTATLGCRRLSPMHLRQARLTLGCSPLWTRFANTGECIAWGTLEHALVLAWQ